MISPAKHQAIQVSILGVSSIFDFLLFTVAVAKEDLLRTPLHHNNILQVSRLAYAVVLYIET